MPGQLGAQRAKLGIHGVDGPLMRGILCSFQLDALIRELAGESRRREIAPAGDVVQMELMPGGELRHRLLLGEDILNDLGVEGWGRAFSHDDPPPVKPLVQWSDYVGTLWANACKPPSA